MANLRKKILFTVMAVAIFGIQSSACASGPVKASVAKSDASDHFIGEAAVDVTGTAVFGLMGTVALITHFNPVPFAPYVDVLSAPAARAVAGSVAFDGAGMTIVLTASEVAAAGLGGYFLGRGIVALDARCFHGAMISDLGNGIFLAVSAATNLKKDLSEELTSSGTEKDTLAKSEAREVR